MLLKYMISGLALIASMSACKKHTLEPVPVKETDNATNVKIVHASAYNTNYSVQLKVNDARVSNAFTYSTPFPGGGLNTGGSNFPWYLALGAGNTKISMSVPKVGTSTDSIPLFTTNINLERGKYYSLYLADTLANTQVVLVNENTAPPSNNNTRFKFVNLMPNAILDLYFAGNLVASNIAFKGVSTEFTVPGGSVGQWAIRVAGSASTSTPITTYPTGTTNQTLPNQRVMTVFARGYNAATGNRAPAVSLLYN